MHVATWPSVKSIDNSHMSVHFRQKAGRENTVKYSEVFLRAIRPSVPSVDGAGAFTVAAAGAVRCESALVRGGGGDIPRKVRRIG